MEHVTKLLKGRKAAAKLELSYCEEGNEHYDKAREKLTDEIKQLDKSLLILSNVVWQGEPCGLLHSTDWNGKCFKCGEQVFVR